MSASSTNAGIGRQLGDDPEVVERCLVELRKIQQGLVARYQRKFEFFDFGLDNWEAGGTLDEKIERLTRICIWHSVGLKHEFHLKLLHTIDGYLGAIDARNPVSTFLLARYLLELVATVSEIAFMLDDCMQIGLSDWRRRGVSFSSILYRARHSTSDKKIETIFEQLGVPRDYYQPIRISKALKRLTTRHGFGSAISLYGTLSNICHHNGSGHMMLVEDARVTNAIANSGDFAIFLKEKTSAVTLEYPGTGFHLNALGLSARVAWWSAASAAASIRTIPESPFSDKEISKLTSGRLTSVGPADQVAGLDPETTKKWIGATRKPRRNDQCSCGSGRKYKFCCGR